MEDKKYEQLEKDVNRMNEEGFVPEGKQLRVFRNGDDLISAIRNNEIPGITWTEEDEAKWQASQAIEGAFESIDWTDPSISEEEVNHQWDELFENGSGI